LTGIAYLIFVNSMVVAHVCDGKNSFLHPELKNATTINQGYCEAEVDALSTFVSFNFECCLIACSSCKACKFARLNYL
jgi:hypothetical protein